VARPFQRMMAFARVCGKINQLKRHRKTLVSETLYQDLEWQFAVGTKQN